jgi:hypothetical protein
MLLKISKYILCSSLAVISACSLVSKGPQPNVVYERPDLTNKVEKLIIFPTTNFEGQETKETKAFDASINGSWIKVYGKDKVIPAGVIIKKVVDSTGKNSYNGFINTLDNVSSIEQVLNNTNFKKFVSTLTDKISDVSKSKTEYHFALAIISGGEKEYNAGQPVYLHLGLFDVKNFTWRVVTKIEIKKSNSPLAKWQLDSQQAIHNSIKYFQEMNESKK